MLNSKARFLSDSGATSRCSSFQPEVIVVGDVLSPLLQIIFFSSLTLFSVPLPLGQPNLISVIFIVALPSLISIHETRLPLILKLDIAAVEQTLFTGEGVVVGVGL